MNLKKITLIALTVLWGSAIGALQGQAVYDLNFQGILADIQGNDISNEGFDLSVQLKHETGQDILYEFSSVTFTDEEGWFGFTISEISRFLIENGQVSKPIVLRMEFLPNENTKWMRKGEDFMVTYTLTPSMDGNQLEIVINRMEGTELVLFSEDHLFAFKDQYPFAMLSGGFLITDQPPVSQESIAHLKQWISPDEDSEIGARSRGVKGGFPAGGYYKKD